MQKNENEQELKACNYNVMNVRYLEESRGVTAIQWIPRPPLSVPFGRPLPFPLLSSHSGSVHGTFLASRGPCSCRGREFANSTHSDMIDNSKPLHGPAYFVFKCSCRPPRLMKKCRPGPLPGSPVPKTAPGHVIRGIKVAKSTSPQNVPSYTYLSEPFWRHAV